MEADGGSLGQIPYSSDPVLERYFSPPLQRTQDRHKMNTQQWSYEEGRCLGSAFPVRWQTPTKLGLRWYERGRRRGYRDELCGFQSVSRSRLHLQTLTIINLVRLPLATP